MTKPHNHSPHQRERGDRMTAAAVTGLLAGLTRAIVDVLLRHLTTSC